MQPQPAAATPTAAATAAGAPAASTVPAVKATAEATTTVENELYRITFTNRGGHVASWILKQFKDSDGKPLDLVHHQAAEPFGHPLSLYTYEPALTAAVNNALYVPSATGNLPAPASLTFKYSEGNIEVIKTFSFDETYVLHADVQILRNGSPVRALVSWPGGFGDQDNAQAYAGAQVDFSRDGRSTTSPAKKVSGGDTLNGPFDWAGVSGNYFAAIFLPDAPANATVATLPQSARRSQDHPAHRPRQRLARQGIHRGARSSAPRSATSTATPRPASTSVPRPSTFSATSTPPAATSRSSRSSTSASGVRSASTSSSRCSSSTPTSSRTGAGPSSSSPCSSTRSSFPSASRPCRAA